LFAATQVSKDFECNIASVRGEGVKFVDAQTILDFLFQKNVTKFC